MDVAVVRVVIGGQAAVDLALHDRAGDGGLGLGLAQFAIAERIGAAEGVGRPLSDDIDHARGGVLAEQGALRSAQNLDVVDIDQIEAGGCLPALHDAIQNGGDTGLDAVAEAQGADAADAQPLAPRIVGIVE